MTKFVINKLEIQNFRSIKEKVELVVKPGLFTIEGINYDEPNSRNGAGKSSLISAIYWCLTGTTLTNEVLADEVINEKAGKDCYVTLYIKSNENEIELTRTRKHSEHGNNLILKIDGQDVSCHKIADTQERLNQLIRIPFNLLHSTIMMTHDIKSAFSDLSPQQRIQTLESIRDYSIWDKVREEANKDSKLCDKEINEKTQLINEMTGSYKTYDSLLKTLLTDIEETKKTQESLSGDSVLKEYDKQITEATEQVKAKKAELEELQNLQLEDLSHYDEQIKQLYQEQNSAHELLNKQFNEEMAKLIEDNQVEENKAQKEIAEVTKDKHELLYAIKDLRRHEEELNKWFSSTVCPTCGHPFERTEKEINEKTLDLNLTKIGIEDQEKKVNAFAETITKNELLIKNAAEEYTENHAKVEKKYKDLMDQSKNCFEKQIAEINTEYKAKQNNQKESKEKIVKTTQEISSLESKISELNTAKVKVEQQIEGIKSKLQKLTEDKKKYEDEIEKIVAEGKVLRANINEVTEKKQLCDYYYKLLGSKGELRPYLLNKDIENLNGYMQRYIHTFFKNTDVNLRLNGAAIEIDIDCMGIRKTVSRLSGGEKKRLDLAIQFALYDLLQSTSQVSFNILCLDEIEAQLDSLGCEQLTHIIEDLSERVETAYWITNNDMVSEAVPHKIICKKALGATHIEEV